MMLPHQTYTGADEMWFTAIDMVMRFGTNQRGGVKLCREILGWCGRLMNPTRSFVHNPVRELSPIQVAAELLEYLEGNYDLNQLDIMNRRLKESKTTGGIIIPWRTKSVELCFLVRNDRLHLLVDLRENSLWDMPRDLFCFANLQCLLAEHNDLKLGFCQYYVGSLYLYAKDFSKVDGMKKVEQFEMPKFLKPPYSFAVERGLAITINQGLRSKNRLSTTEPSTRWGFLNYLASCQYECTSDIEADLNHPISQRLRECTTQIHGHA